MLLRIDDGNLRRQQRFQSLVSDNPLAGLGDGDLLLVIPLSVFLRLREYQSGFPVLAWGRVLLPLIGLLHLGDISHV